jgi:hypothetical protein
VDPRLESLLKKVEPEPSGGSCSGRVHTGHPILSLMWCHRAPARPHGLALNQPSPAQHPWRRRSQRQVDKQQRQLRRRGARGVAGHRGAYISSPRVQGGGVCSKMASSIGRVHGWRGRRPRKEGPLPRHPKPPFKLANDKNRWFR